MHFRGLAGLGRCGVALATTTLLIHGHGSVAVAQDAPTPPTSLELTVEPEVALALEEGLLLSYQNVDNLALVGALRSSITAVFESYCALSNLLPDDNGYDAWTLGLGLGCLAGAATLFYLSGRRINDFASRSEAHGRWVRFQEAKENGISNREAERFEQELASAAHDDEVTRWVGFGLGVASLIASGVLFTLSAVDELDPAVGVSVGTGAVLVGGLSLFGWLLEGPDEQAWDRYRSLTARPR